MTYVRVAPWVDAAFDKARSLGEPFEHDGDVWGASDRAVAEAARFCLMVACWAPDTPPPSMVPGRGSLNVEWHTGDVDIEIEFVGDGTVEVFVFSEQTGCDVEYEIDVPYSVVGVPA